MEALARQALDFVLALEGPAVSAAVGFLTWAEAAFFLGLVTPGEIAMVVGGALASRGQVAVAGVAAAASVGSVLGNATGYWMGRRWGDALLGWGPLRRLLGRSIDATRRFFGRHGDGAVVVGQFVSYVRIFVPFLAGASGVPVRRFLLFNGATAVVWSVAWVMVGLALGQSWRALQGVAGPASFLVLTLFLLALAIRWAAAAIVRRRDRVTALGRWLRRRPAVRAVRRRYGSQLRWLRERLDPRLARGLNLTLGFTFLLVGSLAAGVVLNQVENVRGIARIDFPVLEWTAATRTEAAVRVARTVLEAFRVPGFLGPALLLGSWAAWRVGWGAATRALLGLLGSGLGAYLLDQHVLAGVVPRAGFPSVPVAVAAALMVHLAAAAGERGSWGGTVSAAAVGLFLACTVALATLVAGWAAPSGIALGGALGLTWSTAVELSVRIA